MRNERLIISIENVRYGKEILSVNLQVYDTDGMPGVYIPGSVNREAGKEALSDASGKGGYNVTRSTGVKEQLTIQAAQTGLSGIRSLASRKARAVNVHAKTNCRVFLYLNGIVKTQSHLALKFYICGKKQAKAAPSKRPRCGRRMITLLCSLSFRGIKPNKGLLIGGIHHSAQKVLTKEVFVKNDGKPNTLAFP